MKLGRWTEAEDDFLRQHFRKDMTAGEISKALDRLPKSAGNRAKVLGISRSRVWTDEEMQIVRELYPTKTADKIAKKLGKSASSVYNAAFNMEVKKDPVVLAEQNKKFFTLLRESGKSHRFSKGHVPANKGVRRPGWSAGRMKETQFKKGGFSANRREIGDERISRDGYVYVKVADGKKNKNWRQKHWVVWEDHHGSIPARHIVAFKDRNKQNCDISNLELITLKENMQRNTVHNYPEPVKGMIHQLAGFNRRLNKYAKKQDRRSTKSTIRNNGKAA